MTLSATLPRDAVASAINGAMLAAKERVEDLKKDEESTTLEKEHATSLADQLQDMHALVINSTGKDVMISTHAFRLIRSFYK